jgi:hypothetical protein
MTTRDRMVLIGIVVVAIVGAGWMLVVSPERKQAASLDSKVSAAQSQLSTAQGEVNSARSAQAKYASAYASVVSLGKAVPAGQEVPSLIYQLSQATQERDVQFNSITSGGGSSSSSAAPASTAATAAGFTDMPFTFIFGGGYFDLERLFRELTSFTNHSSTGGLEVSGRLLTIQSVKLSPEAIKTGGQPTLTGTISATAYVLPPGESLTAGATPSSPTGATTPAASSTSSSTSSSPAVIKVTP